jgi:hypothetical protein
MKSSKPAPFGALLGFSLLALLAGSSLAQDYVFNAASFATGRNPQSAANADLNGDGRLDLVVTNFDDNTVSVLLGTPAGTYSSRVDYATGPNPVAVLIADFNSDTKLDVAVVNNNCPTLPCTAVGSVSVLLGNGDGTFQAHLDTNVGNSPNAFAAADFNADTKLDLVVTNGQDNTMTSLLGKNTGKFSVRKVFTTGLNPRGVALGDFSNRGQIDAFVANSGESDITLFRGKGDGTFSQPLVFATAPNPDCIAGIDFTGDGRLDVATGNLGSATVSILMNKDPSGFIPHFELSVAGTANSIVLGDFNGDKRPDIATLSSATDAVSIIIGNGDATFLPHADYATGSDPVGLTLGDLTGDGKPDLAVVNNLDNLVNILPGVGNGTFQSRQPSAVGNMPSAIATGDFNSDAIMDMAVANRTDNTVLIMIGNADGTFTPAAGSPPPTGSKPVALVAVDLNHDDKLDLAVANSGDNTVSILAGNGDGTFLVRPSVTVGQRPSALAWGDFNHDTKPDLVVVNQNDPSISILQGNGDGSFQVTHTYFTGPGSVPTGVAVGAFTASGKPDLAVSNSGSNALGIFLGFGNGSFTSMASYPAGTGPSAVAIADFNGDGMKDVAVSNSGGNNVSIFPGNGTGTFSTHVEYPTTQNPLSVAGADFNKDGKPDLAVAGSSGATGNRVSILLGNGDNTFQPRVDHASRFFQQNSVEALAVADFNDDGSPDFVVVDQVADAVSVFLNTPLPVAFPSSLDFDVVAIGVPSPSKAVTLTNSGGAPLSNLTGATTSPEYSYTTGCNLILNVGESCQTDIIFTPILGGVRAATLTFTDNAPGPPQNVPLTGEGDAPAAVLSVTSLTFGVTQVRQTSAKQNVTLTNTGTQQLHITSIAVSAEFKQSNTCGGSVEPGGTCVISVAFKPLDSGTRTGTLTVTDDAVDSPQTVSLTGTGTIVQLVPTSMGFGPVPVGGTSDPQFVTLTNVGNRALLINSILPAGDDPQDFQIVQSTCPISPAGLAKGTSCTFGVTFTPTQTGTRKATASLDDDGGGSPQHVSLSGNGT